VRKKSFKNLWLRKDLGQMSSLTWVAVPSHGALIFKVKYGSSLKVDDSAQSKRLHFLSR
jgi:hypothetical protein